MIPHLPSTTAFASLRLHPEREASEREEHLARARSLLLEGAEQLADGVSADELLGTLAERVARMAEEAEDAARERARELAAHNAELRRRDRLLDALVRASTLLQESDDFDAAVASALGVLGEAAGMDRVALLEFIGADGGPGLDHWRLGYEWCAPGILPDGGCAGGPFAALPEWRARIAAGETLLEARTRDLPDPDFRAALSAAGVLYTLTVAITADGAAWGGLAMDDCTTDRLRTDPEKAVFAAAARAFGLAVRRRRALQREAEAERRLLVERERAALRRGEALARAGTALQRAVDAVSRADDLDAFVPAVLDIVGSTFAARSCAYYEFGDDGTIFLRYWFVDGRTRRPHELMELDGERFRLMRDLARGCRAPDEYRDGGVQCPERRCVFVDHAAGTCMPEWDDFARREGWESELRVPLFVDGTPDAELVIYRGAEDRYTADEVALADTLGKQLALAMAAARRASEAREAAVARERERAAEERAATLARVNDALERRGRLLAAVSDVSRLLLSAGDPSTVFARAIATLGSAAGVDRAGMMVNRPPDAGSRRGYGELVAEWTAPGVPRQSDHPQSRVINWDDAGDEPFARWIGGEAVIVTDRLPEPMRAAQAAVGVHTQVGFPIFIGAEFWGSIGFDDCTGGREWDEGELSALRVAATTIAGAVQRSRAEAEVVAARERAAEERAAELARANQALVGSLDTLAGEADLDHFLVAVLRRIREVSGAWAAHLFRYREKERTLALHVAVRGDGVHFGPAPGDPPLFAAPIPVDHSPGWAYMLETREIIVSGSAGRDDLFWPEAVAWHREQGHSELAALTLVAAGNPVGVLGLTFRGGGNLQATQAELVQTLLTQLTLALRLTSLAETAREAAVAVERERAVQERAAELVRANRALSRTLSRLGDGVDAEAFLRRVLQTITRHFAAPSSTLWLYDQERMEAHLHLVCVGDRVMSGPESDHPNALVPAPLDVGMFGDLRFAADRRVRVTDVGDASISDSQRAHLHACGAKAMIGVPLLLGDRVLGLIGVRIPEERPIRPEEREVAQALAHQATLALQLSRLAREAQDAAVAQERERAAHARAAELARANDALRRSADRLAGEGLPGPLLDGMLQEIAQAVAPADTAVYLRDAASGLLRLHARVRGESAPSGRADGEWTPDERGATEFLGRLMAEGRDWAAFDTAAPTGEDGWDAKRAKMMAMGISSAVSVVLRAGDEVVGLLTVGLRGRPPLNAEEAELVRALANQAALVLLLTRLGDRAREEARASAVLGERNRIAREIHDTLAQGLTGIIFGLEGALRGAGETAEPVRRQVGVALEVARESLAEARRSLWALRPVPLAAEGLEGALRRLVEQHRDGAVEIVLEVVGDGEVHLPHAEAELGLLRVAQEAVSNALRHAGAARVVVRLEHSDDEVRLTVTDDGRGFDPESLEPGQSFGITGMRERAARAGGRIEIGGAPGGGTVVSLRLAGSSPG